jgi:ATP-binding cassette subfamily B protein
LAKALKDLATEEDKKKAEEVEKLIAAIDYKVTVDSEKKIVAARAAYDKLTDTQKAELYSRSIEANIRWGKDDATPWQIKDAATVAQADDFICRTANGYYTLVSEGGHSLSGGQKQRLSISRAIIKNAEILIFDDSTSALDLKTEAKLYSAMKKSFDDTSKIIIAQRIASVKDADRIIVLEGGRISAMGSHEELLFSSDVYKEIYNSQLKGGALDE